MKFGAIHRAMTLALAALGLLALVTSGELAPAFTIGTLVGILAASFLPDEWREHERFGQAAGVLAIGLLAVQLGRLFFGADVLPVAVEFAASLQVIRLLTRRGAAHDQQIILLSLVHLVAGTVLGAGLAYGFSFLAFLVVAPGALVLSHLRREVEGNYRQGARDRTGLPVDVPRILRSRRVISRRFLLATSALSLPIFLFTALLFVLFPRVGLSLLLLGHSRSTRMVGFSDRVDLGGVGRLRSDPTIALRVTPAELPANPPPRIALYLRGTAFDEYDGRTWSRSRQGRLPAEQIGAFVEVRPYPSGASVKSMQIDLEPITPPVVPLPDDALAFQLIARGDALLGRPTPIFVGAESEFRYTGDERGLRYDVLVRGTLAPPVEALSPADRARYLGLPEGLSPRIAELARTWAAGAREPLEAARAIERHLRTEYRYDLESPSGAAANPLEDFLFESRRGHCEFYSTAMAVLLRSLDVPTRNVTGFVGGTYNRFGRFYAVRQGDAHSWVEVHAPGIGWRRFDPTPPASAAPHAATTGLAAMLRDIAEAAAQRWSRYVVGYDLEQQLRFLRWLSERDEPADSAPKGLAARLSRRPVVLVAGVLLIGGSFAYWWFRLRRRGGGAPSSPAGARERLEATQIVALYRELEAALLAHGVPRVASTPPLAHAESLAALGNPVGEEALALTSWYLAVRFGGAALSEADRREYARRVRVLREAGLARAA